MYFLRRSIVRLCLTWHTAQVRVQPVDAVVASIVETKDNVTLDAVGVVDEKVGDGSAVWDEVGTNAFGRDLVFAVGHGRRAIAGDHGAIAGDHGTLGKGHGLSLIHI